MLLTNDERERLDAAVAGVEAATGAQVVIACLPKSDAYPELPWLAFAFAAALAALVVFAAELFGWGWITGAGQWFSAAVVLIAGATAVLAAAFVPPFARLFLSRTRAEGEVRQQAQSLFLEHELFGTRERCGVLLLVSEFERQVVVLPDKGVRERVPAQVVQEVVNAMLGPLERGELAKAFDLGLSVLEAALVTHGFRGGKPGAEELPNRVG
ncbi:MAG TPA: hypothetical protein VF203_01830 [Burkholderiales bacterium]